MTNLPHTQAALKRRKQLMDALLELMRAKGYAQATVADICREASIPRRTFYHYFDCKEAVVDAVIEDRDPQVTPVEAMKAIRLIEAIYKSAKTGETVYF